MPEHTQFNLSCPKVLTMRIFLLLLLITQSAVAQSIQDVTCKIIAPANDGQYVGSGVLVDTNKVLTCSHVFRGANSVYASFNGKLIPVIENWHNPSLDLAILTLKYSPNIQHAYLSDTPPNKGDSLTFCGLHSFPTRRSSDQSEERRVGKECKIGRASCRERV